MFSTGPPLPLPLCANGFGVCKPWRHAVGRTLPSCRFCPLLCLFLSMCHLQLQVTVTQPLTGCSFPCSIGGCPANVMTSKMQTHCCGTARRLLLPNRGIRRDVFGFWATAILSVPSPSMPHVRNPTGRITPAFGTCSTWLYNLRGTCPIPSTETSGQGYDTHHSEACNFFFCALSAHLALRVSKQSQQTTPTWGARGFVGA